MKVAGENVTNTTFDSSMIEKSSYNHQNKTLTISMVTGKTYRYFNVDEDTFNRFVYAESQGIFFNEVICDEFCREPHNISVIFFD